MSDETRRKLSIANSDENNSMYGKHHTEETKERLRQANLGKILSEEHKQKISDTLKGIRCGEDNPMYGRHHSEQSKRAKSIGSINASNKYKEEHNGEHWNTGREITEETRDKLTIFRKCPYCGKEGRGSAMIRWHFDNCKYKDSYEL